MLDSLVYAYVQISCLSEYLNQNSSNVQQIFEAYASPVEQL